MNEFLAEWYDWIKAFHVISVIAWMAGMLYLPRLYAYHADAKIGSELSETLKIMEQRLLRIIINPAMIASYIFGISILCIPGVIGFGKFWIWVKLFCVVFGLGLFHVFLAKWRKSFEIDKNRRPSSFYRKINEVPTVLLIIIVVMVIVRPF